MSRDWRVKLLGRLALTLFAVHQRYVNNWLVIISSINKLISAVFKTFNAFLFRLVLLSFLLSRVARLDIYRQVQTVVRQVILNQRKSWYGVLVEEDASSN